MSSIVKIDPPPDREFVAKALYTLRVFYPNYHPANGRGERSGEWAMFIQSMAPDIMRYDRIVVIRTMKRIPKHFPDVRFPNGGQILSVLNAERRAYRIEQEHINAPPTPKEITTSCESSTKPEDRSEVVKAFEDLCAEWAANVSEETFEVGQHRIKAILDVLSDVQGLK